MSLSIPSPHDLFVNRDQRFLIEGAIGLLEVMTRAADIDHPKLNNTLVIICHPHPQHGGTMDNKVVTTVARAARESGIDSVRFNYRGVGESEGTYGEFSGECDDFDSILRWVNNNTQKTHLILVGFSFGSGVVASRVNKIENNLHSVLIAPPIERYAYPPGFIAPVSIIQGSDDEVLDAAGVTRWVESLNCDYDYYYSGKTSHFFHGKLIELRRKLGLIFSAVQEP